MTRRFQSFDFRRTPYNRPSDLWLCGYAAEGRPCPRGPSAKGRCQQASECQPRRSGDTWACGRPEAQGGPCAEGPLPDGSCCRVRRACTPQPSLRNLRGRLNFWVTAIVVSILLVSFASTHNMLSIPAGQRIKGHGELTDCGQCHVVFDTGNWILAAFRGDNAAADSAKCTACHDRGGDPLQPHSLPRSELQRLTSEARARDWHAKPAALQSISAKLLPLPEATDTGIACPACHTEHMGAEFDVTAVSNARCQSCHETKFRSFAEGHPPFERYPYLRRTRLVFDHQAHFARNFAEAEVEGAPRVCKDCHIPDATERHMLVKPFEETCAPCHAKDIKGQDAKDQDVKGRDGAVAKGIPVLTIPGLDLESLRRAGVEIGQWPDGAPRGSIPPFMRLLIAADDQSAADLARIERLDLMDLGDAGPKELEALRRIAWAIKDLVYDFVALGPDSLNAKVAHTLGHHLDEATQGDMVAKVPLDAVLAAREAWFPQLEAEVLHRRLGRAAKDLVTLPVPEDPKPIEAEVDSEAWAAYGGWFRKGYTLYYRPNEHRDPFVRSWLDIAARSQGTSAQHHGQTLLTLFRNEKVPGQCTRCHSLEWDSADAQSGRLLVNWRPFTPDPGHSGFTQFDHASHFRIVGEKGCGTCHRIDAGADYAGSFKGFDPMNFQSNFAPAKIEVCSDCHVQESVGGNCTQCHRYHVGSFPAVPVATEISGQAAAAPEATAPAAPTAARAAADGTPLPRRKPLLPVRIRLSSHRTHRSANEALHHLKDSFAGLLGEKHLFIDHQEHDERGPFYRLIASSFADPAAAEAACAELRAQHHDCFVLSRGAAQPSPAQQARQSVNRLMRLFGLRPSQAAP